MSESSNSEKQEKLKSIIKRLHEGADIESVKKEFSKLIKNVSPDEISDMENALINEGMPAEEVQRLCDIHVEVFKASLKKQKKESKIPGHPVHSYIEENKALKGILRRFNSLLKKISRGNADEKTIQSFISEFNKLKEIEKHYTRKENQLFPFLEQKGFSGPSKVMWGKHDEVRGLLKQVQDCINNEKWNELTKAGKKLSSDIKGMIFKEEKILFPTAMKKLNQEDWVKIRKGENEIGYAWITPGNVWDANLTQQLSTQRQAEEEMKKPVDDTISNFHLDEGTLTLEQMHLMLKNLPLDISFVDENDKVKYYSATDDRIFPRSPGVIGRDVHNCHPPKSVHVVERILQSFKNKEKKNAEFWITMNDRFIHIRYFALYDNEGRYKGVIEVSQDVTDIRSLQGEKRLLDW